LTLETRKFCCLECGRTFWQRFSGILPRKRATEPFRRIIYLQHWDEISRSRLSRRQGIGSAPVERWFQNFLQRARAERSAAVCPRVLGIDEHFFSRRQGYAATFCDLRGHEIFDVVLGRSEAALEDICRNSKAKTRCVSSAWIWPASTVPWFASTSRRPGSWLIDSL
jgi:transposase